MTTPYPSKLGATSTLIKTRAQMEQELPVSIRNDLKLYRRFRLAGNICVVLSFIFACIIAGLGILMFLGMSSKSMTNIVSVGIVGLLMLVIACILGPKRAKLRPIYERYGRL